MIERCVDVQGLGVNSGLKKRKISTETKGPHRARKGKREKSSRLPRRNWQNFLPRYVSHYHGMNKFVCNSNPLHSASTISGEIEETVARVTTRIHEIRSRIDSPSIGDVGQMATPGFE